MNNLSMIASRGKNGELGRNNQLIWRFHEDMKFFKKNTINKDIVMGRKTLESLPGLLPKRRHIVLTHSDIYIPGVIVFHNKNDILNYAFVQDEEVVIIGGESIYRLFIDDVDRILLTEIDDVCVDADAFFPDFNQDNFYKNILGKKRENNINFQHVEYTRKLRR